MVIVAGHLLVDPEARAAYLAGCAPIVERARRTAGCLDFSLAPDPVDPSRVNVFEHWESRRALDRFRGDGSHDDPQAAVRSVHVADYEVDGPVADPVGRGATR